MARTLLRIFHYVRTYVQYRKVVQVVSPIRPFLSAVHSGHEMSHKRTLSRALQVSNEK
jgi:hypothetical protein